jgi:hypothetical protein
VLLGCACISKPGNFLKNIEVCIGTKTALWEANVLMDEGEIFEKCSTLFKVKEGVPMYRD